MWHAYFTSYINITYVLEIGSDISSIADADYPIDHESRMMVINLD
jgi:hypothetical protein